MSLPYQVEVEAYSDHGTINTGEPIPVMFAAGEEQLLALGKTNQGCVFFRQPLQKVFVLVSIPDERSVVEIDKSGRILSSGAGQLVEPLRLQPDRDGIHPLNLFLCGATYQVSFAAVIGGTVSMAYRNPAIDWRSPPLKLMDLGQIYTGLIPIPHWI
ncbi:hypothetical protein CEXT_143841 [Caerostris extrusa]|uniref:Uncharacterized protein n=1 Tax=Caerostris extrusa TaxID=172846 RepID=A0AAV4Y450_CAEEX|nr:hypothetical protein CEXT_143841 [Caerostris extrusa]